MQPTGMKIESPTPTSEQEICNELAELSELLRLLAEGDQVEMLSISQQIPVVDVDDPAEKRHMQRHEVMFLGPKESQIPVGECMFELHAEFPHTDVSYLGDDARCGVLSLRDKSEDTDLPDLVAYLFRDSADFSNLLEFWQSRCGRDEANMQRENPFAYSIFKKHKLL